jgi:hypothetical protein
VTIRETGLRREVVLGGHDHHDPGRHDAGGRHDASAADQRERLRATVRP